MNCSQLKFISGRNVQKNSSRASFVRCESSFLIQWHRTWVGWFLMHYHFWEKEKVGQISVLCGRFLENSWKSCSFSRKSWFGLQIIEKRGSLRLKQLINPLPWMCEFLWELEVAAFNLFLFFFNVSFQGRLGEKCEYYIMKLSVVLIHSYLSLGGFEYQSWREWKPERFFFSLTPHRTPVWILSPLFPHFASRGWTSSNFNSWPQF